MSKSVYSLVLNDEVIARIDRLSYQNGTNRSNMINQILAEYISYTRPEKRIEQIFHRIESVLRTSDTFKFSMQPSDTLLSLNSSLTYKYNPSVKYSIELYRNYSDEIGNLRVSMRTQNSALVLALIEFYRLWDKIESAKIGGCETSIDSLGRYTRKIRPRINKSSDVDCNAETLGSIIADYIRAFDMAMKAFFYNINSPKTAVTEVENIYREYLLNSKHII